MEEGMGESGAWPSAEGLAVGLALPGGSLAGKEECGGRQGDIGEDVHAQEVRN